MVRVFREVEARGAAAHRGEVATEATTVTTLTKTEATKITSTHSRISTKTRDSSSQEAEGGKTKGRRAKEVTRATRATGEATAIETSVVVLTDHRMTTTETVLTTMTGTTPGTPEGIRVEVTPTTVAALFPVVTTSMRQPMVSIRSRAAVSKGILEAVAEAATNRAIVSSQITKTSKATQDITAAEVLSEEAAEEVTQTLAARASKMTEAINTRIEATKTMEATSATTSRSIMTKILEVSATNNGAIGAVEEVILEEEAAEEIMVDREVGEIMEAEVAEEVTIEIILTTLAQIMGSLLALMTLSKVQALASKEEEEAIKEEGVVTHDKIDLILELITATINKVSKATGSKRQDWLRIIQEDPTTTKIKEVVTEALAIKTMMRRATPRWLRQLP